MSSTEFFLLALRTLILASVFMQAAVGVSVIDVKPSELVSEISTSLEVNCSFTMNQTTNLAAIISLIVDRSNDSGQTFSELATITEFSPHKVNLLTSENVTADGFLNDAGESFLHLWWQFPSVEQSGTYRCSAQGFDLLGHTISVTASAQANVREPKLDDFVDKVIETSSSLKETVEELKDQIKTLECSGLMTDTYFTPIEQAVMVLNTITNSLDVKVLEIENNRQKCDPRIFQNTSLVYQDRKYCLSRDVPISADAAAVTCKSSGGYLVEIDNLDEYHAIQEFMRNTTGIEYVLIAGSDAVSEGHWVFPSTNQNMPVLDWPPGEPGLGDCLLLILSLSWRMGDGVCENFINTLRFLCEMPLA